MAFVTLPKNHAEADFALAVDVASCFELEELHVFHTEAGPGQVERPQGSAGVLGLLAEVGTWFERLGERLVAPRVARDW